jgi:hypothetical protein
LHRRHRDTIAPSVHEYQGDGRTIRGWKVHEFPRNEERLSNGELVELWYTEWILSTDGAMWEYTYDWERGRNPEERSGLRPVPEPHLVGESGQPFEEISNKLKRARYQ